MTKETMSESKYQLFEKNDNLYLINETNDIFKLDMDKDKNTDIEIDIDEKHDIDSNQDKKTKDAILNKTIEENNMDFEMKETSETKPDGSTAMMERRISQCMDDDSGKSREQCTKEVIKKMKEKGSENTIEVKEDTIEDKKEDKKDEEEEENKEEVDKKEDMKEPIKEVSEKKEDTIEICKKEYDFMKKEISKIESIKTDKQKTEKELNAFKKDFLKFKDRIETKEAAEREELRQEVMVRISNDFDIPEEELLKDSIEELNKLEKRLDMALKRDNENEEEIFDEKEDFESMANKMKSRYFLEV